jgi:hypothetical protein
MPKFSDDTPGAPDFDAYPAVFLDETPAIPAVEAKAADPVADQDARVVTLSVADLKAMMTDAIAADRAQHQDLSQMGQAIGAAVSAGMEKNARRKVPFGDYIRRVHTSTHPDPKFPNGPKLNRETLINGARADVNTLQDREITLLNQLTHSGRYLNRLVEVAVINTGAEDEVQIRWNCGTSDQRAEVFPGVARNVVDMLEQIVKLQVEEDQDEALIKAERMVRRRTIRQGQADPMEANV